MIDHQRHDQMLAFLDATDWCGSKPRPLAGDASNRRYFRAKNKAGHDAVIMDSPSAQGEDIKSFLQIAHYLSGIGLSAPEVFSSDPGSGFILLEDLGDQLFAKWLGVSSEDEVELYRAATDVLIAIAYADLPSGVEPYDANTMGALAGLAGTWYAGSEESTLEITKACKTTLINCPPSRPTTALRDYHAENLLWLPDRKGPARVGLLDFQDARIGHQAYDLASLIKDARRDVGGAAQEIAVRWFAEEMSIGLSDLAHAIAAQGAQRNLRILGVFARLSLRFGKPQYIDLIPRVWRNLMEDLKHPTLEELKRTVVSALPEPTNHQLNDLRERCGTIPVHA